MRRYTDPLQVAMRLLNQSEGFLVFVEVPLRVTAGKFIRIVRNTAPIDANGHRWEPVSLQLIVPEEDAEGELGTMTIKIPNVSLRPAQLITDRELDGQRVKVYIQHVGALDTFDPEACWEHVITEFEINEQWATISCKHPAQVMQWPHRVFTRERFGPMVLQGGGIRV